MSFVTTDSANTVEEPAIVHLGSTMGNFPLSQMNLNQGDDDNQLILI